MIYAHARKTEVALSNIYKVAFIGKWCQYNRPNRVLNVRGEIIPLMDLAYRLNHTIDFEKSKIIITYKNNEKIGLIVQSVRDVVDYFDSEVEPTPSNDVAFVTGLIKKDVSVEEANGTITKKTRVLTILDTDKIINDEDTQFQLVD